MAKSVYLKHFQRNLRDGLESLLCDECGYDLLITEEDGVLPGKFNGFMDISIYNPLKGNSVVGIEIEHKSGYNQAIQNINKLKTWAHNSSIRSAGLLHIFNEDCNISFDSIGKLVSIAETHSRKNHGFYYDFVYYAVPDARKTRQSSYDLVFSNDFKTRLFRLMDNCGLLQAPSNKQSYDIRI